MRKQSILLLMRIGLATAILAVLVCSGRLKTRCISELHPALFLLPLPFYLVCFAMGIFRWWYLVRSIGLTPSFSDITRLAMTGIWLSSVLPGGSVAAGDAARVALLAMDCPGATGIALSSVFMDRLLGLFAILGMAGVALLMNAHMLLKNTWLQVLGISMGAVTLFSFLGILVLGSRWTRLAIGSVPAMQRTTFWRFVLKTVDYFREYREHPKTLINGFLISCVGHGSMVLAICVLAGRMRIELASNSAYLFAISVGIIAAMIPISGPAGIGVGNAGFAVTFALMGSDRGAELAAVWQISFVLSSQIGLPFFLMGRRRGALRVAALSPIVRAEPDLASEG